MIITCPSCTSRYRVKDELIQSKGKRVKCKKCSAVFVAFPDREAVVEQAPPAAAPAAPVAKVAAPVARPAAPAAVPVPTEAHQATVKVDRSQLDNFLKSNAADGSQSTLKIDPNQFKNYMAQQQQEAEGGQAAAGATVQVDRSQIDAFLHGQPRPGNSDTVQLDPAAVSSLVQGGAPPVANLGDTQENEAVTAENTAPAPPFGEFPEFETNVMSAEPSFPSDEELGIDSDSGPSANVAAPASPNFAASPVENAFENAFDAPAPPPPQISEEEAQPVLETLYQADVEGKVYPNLRLESILRWVKEDRLLETDMIAINGTQDFRPASSYPEIAPYFGEQVAQAEQEPPKKKGFFARLFSFGK